MTEISDPPTPSAPELGTCEYEHPSCQPGFPHYQVENCVNWEPDHDSDSQRRSIPIATPSAPEEER